ncbi:MAG TPA: adenylate kinase [Bacteroidetes bacterium]|nr:adenylate kinase [Bacteroidota bacterium]
MINVILFGPPGSGKGTQALKISKSHGLIHLSTGDILRKAIANKTPLGIKAKEFMDKGILVPDEDIAQMVINAVDRNAGAKGFIFDGFPRNVFQARFLDRMLEERNTSIDYLIALEVDHDELIKRLLNRSKIEGRTDDNPEVIKNRIKVYFDQTVPVMDYYKSQGKLYPVNGIGTIEEVNERIYKILKKVK